MLTEAEYREYATEIIPDFLYLTSQYEAGDAAFLRSRRITHVLNVAEECEPAEETKKACKVLHLPLQESLRLHLRPLFDEAFRFFDAAKKEGGRILVHCREGRNRSATFVIAYRMRSEKLSLASAFLKTKHIRALLDPNISFRKQLRDFEIELGQGGKDGKPSLPMTAEECCILLELELVPLEKLALYTDLVRLEYEGNVLEINPASAIAPKRDAVETPSRSCKPKAKAVVAKSKARHSSPARRVAASSGNSTLLGDPPPKPRAPTGPLAEALLLLFDALDHTGCECLSAPQVVEARTLLAPLVRSSVSSEFANCSDALVEKFRLLDTNRDGTISRSELCQVFQIISPETFSPDDVDVVLCAADANHDGCIHYEEFLRWVLDDKDLQGSFGSVGFYHCAISMLCPAGIPKKDELSEMVAEVKALARKIKPPFSPYSGTEAERLELSPVLPGVLFLTSWRTAADHDVAARAGITHVVSIGTDFDGDEPLADLGVSYFFIAIEDDEDKAEAMQDILSTAVSFIDTAIGNSGRVLVHCAAGISRSATVVLAYLVAKRGMSLRKAFEHTRRARVVIWPNHGFMRILISWEQKYRGGQPTMRLRQYTLWSEFNSEEYDAAKIVERTP